MNKFEFRVEPGPAGGVKLDKAVLVYSGGERAFATIHAVQIDDGRATILPGRAMTPLAIARLSRQVGRGRQDGGFIPPTLLFRRLDCIAWWLPPSRRSIWFRCEALGAAERTAVVPHPGLIFAVRGKDWLVWAVQGSQRPDPSTALCQAPYFNVYSSGAICRGNVSVPPGATADKIDGWNSAFFGSFFTHPNVQGALVNYRGGAMKFWREMLDGRFTKFPQRVLVPLERTLGEELDRSGAGR